MEKVEYQFLIKIIEPGYNLFFNSSPLINDALDIKISDYYNSDYHYIFSLGSSQLSNIPNEEDLPNHYQNLIKIDSKKVYYHLNKFPFCNNAFYKYFLKLIYCHTNFYINIINNLNNHCIDFDSFSFTVYLVCKTIYYYEEFDLELRLKMARIIINYIEKLEDSQIREINRNYYEGFLRFINQIQFVLIGDVIKKVVSLPEYEFYNKLFSIDMKLIFANFNSQNLEKRIISIKMLTEIIQNVLLNERKDKISENDDPRMMNDWSAIRKRHILDWLDKTKLFELIFGENIHEAILKKSSFLIIFMYINDSLSFDQIMSIWKLAQDKHEAISAAILSIFSDLISSLSIDHALHILKEVNEIPFKEVNDVTLRILESFGNNKFLCVNDNNKTVVNLGKENDNMETDAYKSKMENITPNPMTGGGFYQNENNINIIEVLQNEVIIDNKTLNAFKSFYLKIIWKLSSEKSHSKGLSPTIINKARRILSTILIKPVFKYELAKYIKKCLINIKSNHYLTTNLTILDKIIKNLKSNNQNDAILNIVNIFGSEIKDLKSLINYLDKQYNLVSIFLNAILNLKKECLFLTQEIDNLSSCKTETINQQKILDMLSKSDNKPKNDYVIEEESKETRYALTRNNNTIPQINKNTYIEEEIIKMDDAFEDKSHANNNNLNNLDETLSTEKSMDRTISTISTDISPDDQPHLFLIKDFFEKFGNDKEILCKPEFIIKKLSLNFSNNNYNVILLNLLALIKFFVFHSDVQLKQKHIEFLFEVLVENSIDLEELNIFYQFLADILKNQHLSRNSFFSDEILYFIFFDLILNNDLQSLPLSGFVLFKQMFFLLNTNLNVLKMRTPQIFEISDFSLLLGFESLWQIYLETKNSNIAKESLQLIVNLINSISKGDETSKSSLIYIIEKTFTSLGKYFDLLSYEGNLENVKIDQAIRLINLLFIVNSNKHKFEKIHESEIVNIKIIDNFTNDINKIQFQLPLDTPIKEVRCQVAKKFKSSNNIGSNMNIDEAMITLFYKGHILENDRQSLRDVKFENNGNIIVAKSSGGTHFTPMDIEESRLADLVSNIKIIFELIDEEIIKVALKKNNYNLDETIYYLTDENNVQSIIRELNESNTNNMASNNANTLTFDMFTVQRLELLLKFLDFNIPEISSNIWQLFSAIKFPDVIINNIIDTNLIDFTRIFDYQNINMMLLNIRILNCLIFNDKFTMNIAKLDETKISEWKMNLLLSNGITLVIETICKLLENIQNINEVSCNLVYKLQTLQILTKWLHFFTFSATVSIAHSKDTLGNIVKMIIQKRPQISNLGIALSSTSKDSSPSQATPTFGSRNSSFSDVNKPQIKKALITGAEEYDSYYEEELANNFFTSLIFKNFHLILFTFATFASEPEIVKHYSQENESIYLNLIEILIVLTEMNPVAFKEIIQIEVQKSQLINILFIEKSKFVRKMIENLFILLSQIKFTELNKVESHVKDKSVKSVKEQIMLHILTNYKRIYSDQVYEEFFILFGHFLQSEKDLQDYNIIDFNIKEITNHILENILDLSKKMDSELKEIQQEQLTGNIYLLQCLCFSNEQLVASVLEEFKQKLNINFSSFFYDNLFGIEEEKEINEYFKLQFKYSNRTLRSKVYNLLIAIIKLKDSYKMELGTKLLKHHPGITNVASNMIDLDINIRTSSDKYIGLRNYGATCYLNSLLQQLFMIKEFRIRLYDIPIDINTDLDNNPLYHLQLVFANLSQTLKLFHTPIHFIKSIKGFNNQPINTSQQQDCEEFLIILIDRLEPLVKDTEHEKIFDSTIRGRLAYEICSMEKEYPYYSENIQPCIAISLDIKNKRNIEEGLDLYIKGENLVGENKYFCEKYQKKISVTKRCSIKKLSEVVFIHLKRFEFDYNTFEKIKINDYCEFPMVIDFRPWMWSTIISQNKEDPNFKDVIIDDNESNDSDYFKYQLAGVLVHSGTSECGHYYSFIHSQETDKWYRYDDTRVTEFNILDLKTECFGSEDKENTNEFFQRSRSAYLLLYRKMNSTSDNKSSKDNIPKNLLSQIHSENRLFLTKKTYLDNDYFNFLKEYLESIFQKGRISSQIIKREKSLSRKQRIDEETYNLVSNNLKETTSFDEIDQEYLKEVIEKTNSDLINEYSKQSYDSQNPAELKKKFIKMATYYYLEILIKHKDLVKINVFTSLLTDLFEANKELALWFMKKLIYNQSLFLNVLLIDHTFEVREGIYKIITNSINSLYFIEDKYIREQFKYFVINKKDKIYESGETKTSVMISVREEYRSCIMRFFLYNMIGNFDTLRLHWLKFHQYLYTFNYGLNFLEIVELALNKNIIRTILLFIMNNQQSYETKYPKMGSNTSEPNYSVVIEILANLVTSCIHQGIYELMKYSVYTRFQDRSNKTPLPNGWEIVLDKQILFNTILRKYSSESTKKIIHHLSWGIEDQSKLIIDLLMQTLKENIRDINSINNLLYNLSGLLEIEDGIKIVRIRTIYALDDETENESDSIYNYLLSFRDEMPLNTLICLKILGDHVVKFNDVFNYVSNNIGKLEWVFYFLRDMDNDAIKKDNLQIEASADGINLLEILASTQEIYLEKLRIRNLIQKGNNSNSNYHQNQIDIDMESDMKNRHQEGNNEEPYP